MSRIYWVVIRLSEGKPHRKLGPRVRYPRARLSYASSTGQTGDGRRWRQRRRGRRRERGEEEGLRVWYALLQNKSLLLQDIRVLGAWCYLEPRGPVRSGFGLTTVDGFSYLLVTWAPWFLHMFVFSFLRGRIKLFYLITTMLRVLSIFRFQTLYNSWH